jgi:hypothetical protein
VLLWLLLFAGFVVAAFDQLAIGVALAFTTVAATALATGATARALAIGAFLLVLQQLFVRQLLFVEFGSLFGNLLVRARLALFTRRARLALFAQCTSSRGARSSRGAFFTRRTFFARGALFTRRTFFAWARSSWSALFTGFALFAWCTLFTRLALFAGSWCGVQWLAQFAYVLHGCRGGLRAAGVVRVLHAVRSSRCTLLARCTLFAWLALFARCTRARSSRGLRSSSRRPLRLRLCWRPLRRSSLLRVRSVAARFATGAAQALPCRRTG